MEVKEYALSLIHWQIAKDPWTRAVFLAGGVPLDSLAERILDIASSEDPEGMMERSLERWERILGITPAADATLEERRAAIRMRWLAAAPPSVESLQAICEAWEGGAFAVRYDPARGIILLETAGDEGPKAKPKALKQGVDRAKPAHLAVRLATKATAGLWWGGVTCTADARGWEDALMDVAGDAVLEIRLKQTGTGEPAPDNPRPILPGLTLVRDDETVLEVYGGELDTASGVLTVTHRAVELVGTESWSIAWGDSNPALYTILSNPADGVHKAGVCSRFAFGNVFSTGGVGAMCYVQSGQYRFICRYAGQPETTAGWKALLSQWATDGNPLQAVYPLETPVTIQLTEAEVKRARRQLPLWKQLLDGGD